MISFSGPLDGSNIKPELGQTGVEREWGWGESEEGWEGREMADVPWRGGEGAASAPTRSLVLVVFPFKAWRVLLILYSRRHPFNFSVAPHFYLCELLPVHFCYLQLEPLVKCGTPLLLGGGGEAQGPRGTDYFALLLKEKVTQAQGIRALGQHLCISKVFEARLRPWKVHRQSFRSTSGKPSQSVCPGRRGLLCVCVVGAGPPGTGAVPEWRSAHGLHSA